MKIAKLSDLNILDVGNAIQLYGAIYSGKGEVYLIPLPDEDPSDLMMLEPHLLSMTADDMERFLHQTDVLEVKAGKAILRKSQRQIDQLISWRVFARDGYACRYCGREGLPLTVDHVDLWEEGGATIEANLISSCRRCNKIRGNMTYPEWMTSTEYAKASRELTHEQNQRNLEVQLTLDKLAGMRVNKRSR